MIVGAMLHTCFEQLYEFLRELHEIDKDRLLYFESLELILGYFKVMEKKRIHFTCHLQGQNLRMDLKHKLYVRVKRAFDDEIRLP
jgi:trans-2-enoyl-CoA reductase